MKERKMVELLAPAGNMDSLMVAVQAGANAVYLAGQSFGARQSAGNFDSESLKHAVEYCHLRDVQVYGALNTLIKEDEIPEAVDAAGEMYLAGADALIIQDWGLASLLRRELPDMELHGSTQMSIYDAAGAFAAAKLGLKRVVIARETPIDELERIAATSPIEIEAFVHGALCYCYSGQCLMSSQIGGRSGNRGRCAQPCRKFYRLKGADAESARIHKDGYLLSMRDLDIRSQMDRVLKSGVVSLKIEGRMRKPDYVAAVTGAYREIIDRHYGVETDTAVRSLSVERVFNREATLGRILGVEEDILNTNAPGNMGVEIGLTDGYDVRRRRLWITLSDSLRVGDGVKIISQGEDMGTQVSSIEIDEKPFKDAAAGSRVSVPFGRALPAGLSVRKTLDSAAVEQAAELMSGERFHIEYHGKIQIRCGEPVQLALYDDRGSHADVVSEQLAEPARSAGLSDERIREQIQKSGDPLFVLGNLQCVVDPTAFVPVSILNSLRRTALEQLKQTRSIRYPARISAPKGQMALETERPVPEIQWVAEVQNIDQLRALEGLEVSRVEYTDEDTLHEALTIASGQKWDLCFAIPCISRTEPAVWGERLKRFPTLKHVRVGNVGQLQLFEEGWTVHGDYTLNIMNAESLTALNRLGMERGTVSVELSRFESRDVLMGANVDSEQMVYGALKVMTSPVCPVGCKKPCTGCDKRRFLMEDERSYVFPARCRDGYFEVFNSRILNLIEYVPDIQGEGFSALQLRFLDESPETVRTITDAFIRAAKGTLRDGELPFRNDIHTTGSYKRGVE